MVGLSVVLEAQKGSVSKKSPQVINKTTMLRSMNKQPPAVQCCFQEAKFLNQCFLCRKRLLPGKDIYMYKGDRAFCSVECRCKQILMDEEESNEKEKCCFRATRPTSGSSSSRATK